MKNAQVTIFIIVGIILLIGIGMMIYLVSFRAEKRSEEQVVVQKLRKSVIRSVNDYITSCLDVAAAEALALVGKQGGVLYNTQGSLYPEPVAGEGQDYIVYDEIKVIYDIIPPQGNIGDIYFSIPPQYPWNKFPYVNGRMLTSLNSRN